MSAKLQLINIAFKYKGIGASENYVLHDINLEFNKSECTAVVGPSGSGKTTLIQHFTGLLKPDVGKVLFNDVDIWSKKYSFQELRRKIGIVFQFPESQLFEETVYKDVAFGPTNLGVNASEIPDRVYAALEAVEIKPDKFKDRSPFKLSEGEKRRVAIAGILAMDPEMIVFDEPTAGLDPRGVRRMENLVERLIGAGKSVVLITHNMDFCRSGCFTCYCHVERNRFCPIQVLKDYLVIRSY